MGELIDFAEWKRKKEEKEHQELEEDIARLQKEVHEMISEMKEPDASEYWHQEWLDQLPDLVRLDSLLCGYSEEFLSGTIPGDHSE
jgi:hypothetical protein